MKKTTWSLLNYAEQNTPKLAQKIGNWLLTISGLGLTIIGLPTAMAAVGVEFTVPDSILHYAKYAVAAGVLVKMFTKTLGEVEDKNGNA